MLYASALLAALATQAPPVVWVVTDTRRVLRDEAPGQGATAAVAAARNEWRGFQILLRSNSPAMITGLTVSDLTGPAGKVIPGSAAKRYRQHALKIDPVSFRMEAAAPGWYPGPLIPFEHPLTGQPLPEAALRAVPFELPAGETHGFYVDLYAPPGTVPGRYTGEARLELREGGPLRVPVALTVYDFELPETPTMVTALGDPAGRLRGHYQQRAKEGKEPEPADWAAFDAQVAELLSRHKINATPPKWAPVKQADGTFLVPDEQVDAVRAFVDRYHVNAVSLVHPRSVIKDPAQDGAVLKAWLAAWDAAAKRLDRPRVVLYFYLRDEPNNEEEYRYVQQWGKAVRDCQTVVKNMVVEQTKSSNEAWGDLYGAVDIWCPLFSLHDEETAAQRRAAGESVWTYTALCQGNPTPWWLLDAPLLNYRCPAWTMWRYRMSGLLYWGGMSFWRQVDDPWTDPKTLDRRQQRAGLLYNGEGSLLYPGRAVGYDGVAEGLRVKALRDGIQDYEYCALLERAGRGAEADAIVGKLTSSFFEWDRDPAAYDRARAELAACIVRR